MQTTSRTLRELFLKIISRKERKGKTAEIAMSIFYFNLFKRVLQHLLNEPHQLF